MASALPKQGPECNMSNGEIKLRVFEIIDATRNELISFLSEYVQRRSINPEREIVAVEKGETIFCQKWLCEALHSFGSFETVTSWSVSSGELNVSAQLPASAPGASCLHCSTAIRTWCRSLRPNTVHGEGGIRGAGTSRVARFTGGELAT